MLEIGPGTGQLTKYLVDSSKHVVEAFLKCIWSIGGDRKRCANGFSIVGAFFERDKWKETRNYNWRYFEGGFAHFWPLCCEYPLLCTVFRSRCKLGVFWNCSAPYFRKTLLERILLPGAEGVLWKALLSVRFAPLLNVQSTVNARFHLFDSVHSVLLPSWKVVRCLPDLLFSSSSSTPIEDRFVMLCR